MCGICGIWGELADRPRLVARMCAALTHRGPDSGGTFDVPEVSLAMRRLAIIDLHTGGQPLFNETRDVVLVFNGEIYNFRVLRERLRAAGHRFATRSDGEVILHLYEDHGLAAIPMLEGMFAMAIYDGGRGRLVLARDRMGEKPLFYAEASDVLVFSSELASLMCSGTIPPRVDLQSLHYYLRSGYPPPSRTLFQDVRSLLPGHVLVREAQSTQISRYWDPEYSVDHAFDDDRTAASRLREVLLRVVERQMASDVPLGAFLSGGIDSSTIVAAMQRVSTRPVKTFTVRFEHAPYDESAVARQVARYLGTQHREITIADAAFHSEDLWRIVRHVGQPFADSSAVPTYLISRAARDELTVVLSGDGGDEMFAGYDYFLWQQKIDWLAERLPPVALRILMGLTRGAATVPVVSRIGMIRKLSRAAELGLLPERDRVWQMAQIFEPPQLGPLARPWLQDVWRQDRFDLLSSIAEEGRRAGRLRQLMHYRLKFDLAEDMLVKVDRMSMACSLEVRAPMLDVQMAEFSMRLPDRMLIRNGTSKYILRQAAQEWLPRDVFRHPKTGFSIPLHTFRNKAYRQLSEELLLNPSNRLMHELFEPEALRAVVQRGLTQTRDQADQSVYRATHHLWALNQLGAWLKAFDVSL